MFFYGENGETVKIKHKLNHWRYPYIRLFQIIGVGKSFLPNRLCSISSKKIKELAYKLYSSPYKLLDSDKDYESLLQLS